MRLLALLALLTLTAPARAQTVDGVIPSHAPLFLSSEAQGPWLAADKELHFAGSLAIAASLRVKGQRQGAALGFTVGAGVLKEIYDVALKPRRMGRGGSWKDLAADLAGALAGVALVRAMD
ncbi:MAG TPA: hypothetical protein VFD83_03390 [Candidatus Polarisedimenticolia bacterium]|nr:hypothetical protein [Candidatus Polarisedimenticolia bacterium]